MTNSLTPKQQISAPSIAAAIKEQSA